MILEHLYVAVAAIAQGESALLQERGHGTREF
jgi:hypothetical protein